MDIKAIEKIQRIWDMIDAERDAIAAQRVKGSGMGRVGSSISNYHPPSANSNFETSKHNA